MQDKRFYPYLFLHAGIVTLWVILDRIHKGIANDGVINLLSIASCFVISICSIFM